METKTKFLNSLGKLPFFKKRTYPILVEIVKPRGLNSFQFIPDRARKIRFISMPNKKMVSWQINLLYDHVDVQLPTNLDVITDHKGHEKIYLYNPEPGVYIPIRPKVDIDKGEIDLIVQTQGRTPWLIATIKHDVADLRPESKWLQYLPAISLVIFGVFQVILFFLGTMKSNELVQIMQQASNALTQAIQSLQVLPPP